MPALHPYSPRRTSSRQLGYHPHALQRALELGAAFTIVLTRRGRYNDPAWRRYIATMSPRNLHGWIARYLRTNPQRRIL